MIEITVNTRRAVVTNKELLTTGSAGIQVQFTFSEDWDSLSRFAIFRNGEEGQEVAVALPNSNLVVVPAQSCSEDYVDEPVFVGMYGTDGLGAVIIPTIWTSLGVLRPGAVTTDIITPAEPTPDMWAQILAIANEAVTIADECEANEELRSAAEQLRANAETARANAETLRAQAETERSVNETQRQSAETQRQTAEDARARAETLRVQAEELRQANEANRASAESVRASNERSRQSHELERDSAESLRGIREMERINAEWDRQSAETARASAETSRASAESSRATAEQNRASAEAARASVESERATAESTRASNEQSRVSAEADRVQAEVDRATEFATWESTIASKVPDTRTVNGKALSTDITLDSGDIGYDDTETYQSGSVGYEVADLSRQLSDLPFDATEVKSGNLLNPVNVTTGYYWSDGFHESASYVNTGLIPVEQGKTYTMQIGSAGIAINRQAFNARFIVYYRADGLSVVSSTPYVTNVTPPENAYYVIASYNFNSVQVFLNTLPAFVEGTTILDYEEYVAPHTEYTLKDEANSSQTNQNTQDIADLKEQITESGQHNAIFTASAASLAANTNLICCDSCDNKKNEYIELTAHFSSFGELTIAHGKGSYMGMYITITSDKIQIYNYDGTLIEEYDHGLTLSDFINVIIYTKNDSSCRSKISIMSAGGDYSVETSRYYSSRAAVLCNATFAMTDVEMRYTVNDAKEDVWVFGDSYLSLGDPNRWPEQMVSSGHKNVLLCGFGGAMSANEIISFRALMAVARPKFVVWALGMNDGDSSSAVNVNWKTYVDEVIATCEEKGVTPILATIPNVPNVINTFKNAYVKSLNYRYVDFAKAVNAESTGATWYAGMLSSDNVHPVALGAKALMRQFLLDVPEVLYAE